MVAHTTLLEISCSGSYINNNRIAALEQIIGESMGGLVHVIDKGCFSEAFSSPTERFKQKAKEESFILLVVWRRRK